MKRLTTKDQLIAFWQRIEGTREVPLHEPETVLSDIELTELYTLRNHCKWRDGDMWRVLAVATEKGRVAA